VPATADHIDVAFRFDRAAGRKLKRIAQHLRTLSSEQLAGQNIDISFFDKAAESAEQGEPLIVRCSDPIEATLMRQALTNLGITDSGLDSLG
jgi:hypothetical protein